MKTIEFTSEAGNIYRVVPHPCWSKTWTVAVWSSFYRAWVNEARGHFKSRRAAIQNAQELAA